MVLPHHYGNSTTLHIQRGSHEKLNVLVPNTVEHSDLVEKIDHIYYLLDIAGVYVDHSMPITSINGREEREKERERERERENACKELSVSKHQASNIANSHNCFNQRRGCCTVQLT